MNHVFSRRPTSELPAGAEALLEMKARGKQLLESGAPEDPAGSLVPLIPQGERPVTGYLLDYLQLQPSRLRLPPAACLRLYQRFRVTHAILWHSCLYFKPRKMTASS